MQTKHALKVGITGGIGSGKTTICHIFQELGIPVYYADGRAKWLMVNDPRLVKGIKQLLGEQAYYSNGTLNRAFIADQVFENEEILKQLNALVHPAVADDSDRWHKGQPGVPYTLKEAALLFESNNHLMLDKVISVFAPEDLRIQRVIQRDEMSEEQARSRMSKQMPEAEKLKLADFIIHNDGEQPLIPQVIKIHKILTTLYESQSSQTFSQ